MQITLDNPDLQEFVQQQVVAGHFPTVEAVVEAALARMMLDDPPQTLNPEVWKAIADGNAQFARGDALGFVEFAKELRAKYWK